MSNCAKARIVQAGLNVLYPTVSQLNKNCTELNGKVVVVLEVVVIVVVGAIAEQDNSLIQLEQVAMPACSLPNGIFIANGTNGSHWQVPAL